MIPPAAPQASAAEWQVATRAVDRLVALSVELSPAAAGSRRVSRSDRCGSRTVPSTEARVDRTFARAERLDLGHGAWLDVAPGWLDDDGSVFDELCADAPWEQRRREEGGRVFDEPRLTAWWSAAPDTPGMPRAVVELADALTERYGMTFAHVVAMLYRDGRDHVDLHSDGFGDITPRPLIGIVSLGHPRPLLLRESATDRRLTVDLGHGDLVVMGGEIQQHWQHAVPPVDEAEVRVSLQIRAVHPVV